MDNWKQVEEIFKNAIRQNPEDRAVFLDRVCSDDTLLRNEVESLLDSHDSSESFLETPAVVGIVDEKEATQFEKGKRFGYYEIVRKIGAGGMGEVYDARDSRLDRKAAIKFLNKEYSLDPEKLARFKQEAKAASALNHPNILTVYEIGETKGVSYIAAEFIDGKTLREQLAHRDTLQLSTILKIAIQVSEALSAAHEAGIIHRDIKPENIMIRRDGYIKVLDFGLVKLTEKRRQPSDEESTLVPVTYLESGPVSPKTLPGMIMGTATYMSPEQACGKDVDARTDIWSLGVLLYEMLAGKTPFEGETINHTIVSILEKEPLVLTSAPDELQRIVRKALAKDKDMRYQTARDFSIDLRNLRRDLDIKGELERSLSPNKGESKVKESVGNDSPARKTLSTSSLEYAVTQIKTHKVAASIAGIALLSVILAAAYYTSGNLMPGNQIESIAVMPFFNEGGDSDAEYLSDGMTETLINSLSQVPDLNVKARNSVFRYKGREANLRTLGKDLNVQTILIGRLLQRGDRLTLSVELINAATENAVWGNKYEKDSSELVTLQSQIARDISHQLKSNLADTDEKSVTRTYTTDPDAFKLYLRGRYYWNKRTGDSLKQAVSFYKQALEKDPAYALVYSGLAEAYALYADYNAASPTESFPLARANALKALELDPSLSEPHSVLAVYLNQFKWDRRGAEKEYRLAIELSPRRASAHQWFGYYLATLKRFDEALEELRRAEQLDPLSLITRTNIGDTYIFARRYDDAIAQYKSILALDPDFLYARLNLGWALSLKGRDREAIEEYRKAVDVYYEPLIKANIAVSLIKLGHRKEAVDLLEQLKEESRTMYVPSITVALVYLALDDKGKAIEWLEKDIAERSPYTTYYAVMPELDVLKNDPRFKNILRRLNLPE